MSLFTRAFAYDRLRYSGPRNRTYVKLNVYVHSNFDWRTKIPRTRHFSIYHVTIHAQSAVYANLNILIYVNEIACKQTQCLMTEYVNDPNVL